MRRWAAWCAGVSAMVVLLCVSTGTSTATHVGWGRAIVLDVDAGGPTVGMDFSGNAVIAWESQGNISAGRYEANQPFRRTAMIEDGPESSSSPKIAVSRGGIAIVAWLQRNESEESIWASNSRVIATGWSVPVRLGAARFVFDPDVAVDPGGTGFAVWAQVTDGAHIWASRFLGAATGWSPATEIGSSSGWNAYPKVGVDGQGNAIAVWTQDNGTAMRLWANRFDVTAGTWGTAAPISGPFPWPSLSKSLVRPDLAVGVNGTALVAWTYFDGIRLGIAASRWEPSGGWTGPVAIDGAVAPDGVLPAVAVDAADRGVAVWGQGIAVAGALDLWANRFDAGLGGWGTPVAVENGPGAIAPGNVAVDSSGNAIAVWGEFGGTRWDAWASRLNVARGTWGDEVFIGSFATIDPSFSFVPQVAIGPSGALGIAVWAEPGGSGSTLWANRFLADLTPPPLTVASPLDGSDLVVSTVIVAGTTEPGATITANGIVGSVSPDGSFALPLALTPGANNITVLAEDHFGNFAAVTVQVTYVDRIPHLEQGLDRVLDALTTTLGSLADANDALANANAALAALNLEFLVLLVILVAMVGLSGTLLFLYWRLQRRIRTELAKSAQPPPLEKKPGP